VSPAPEVEPAEDTGRERVSGDWPNV